MIDYPLNKVMRALVEAQKSRKAGKAGPGVSKQPLWAPSDVKRAQEILQRDQASAIVDGRDPVSNIPDIEAPRSNRKQKLWVPSDVKRAEHFLQRDQESAVVDDKDLVSDIPDIKTPGSDKDMTIEELDHTAAKIPFEGQLSQVLEDDLEEGLEEDPPTPSIIPLHDSFIEPTEQPTETSRRARKRRSTHYFAEDPVLQCLTTQPSEDREVIKTPKPRRSSLNLPRFSPSPLHLEHSTATPRPYLSPMPTVKTPRSPSPLQHQSVRHLSPREETEISEMDLSETTPDSPPRKEMEVSEMDLSETAPDSQAFTSLLPDTELTRAAVVTCLRLLLGAASSSKWSMIPSDFDVAEAGAYEEDIQDAEKVLVPLHIEQARHWVLLAIKLNPLEVEVFDSMSEGSSRWKKHIEASVRDLCACHLNKFLRSSTPAVVFRHSLQQVGTTNCGVYTLVNAAYLIAGRRPPVQTDINIWRHTLSSFDYGSALDADAPWKFYPELDDATFEVEDDTTFPRKGARVTDKEWSAALASRKAYEDKVKNILMKARTRNLRQLEELHKDIREIFAVLHDVLDLATPEQREKEMGGLVKEYLARKAILSSLEDIPSPTETDRAFETKLKARKRACLRRLRSIRMSIRALKAAECRLELELEDVSRRQQDLKERGVEVET